MTLNLFILVTILESNLRKEYESKYSDEIQAHEAERKSVYDTLIATYRDNLNDINQDFTKQIAALKQHNDQLMNEIKALKIATTSDKIDNDRYCTMNGMIRYMRLVL